MQFEHEWLPGQTPEGGKPDIVTRCAIGLTVNNHALFRHEDLLNQHQVNTAIQASAYPLATWLVANWWRLRWEPALLADHRKDLSKRNDWSMSHNLGSVGHGYYWPGIVFSSDGESIQLNKSPSLENTGPVRYLERLSAWVTGDEFQSGVSRFVESTLSRLEDCKVENTELAAQWAILQEELACEHTSLLRQLEARLGYDPEEAPEPLLERIVALYQQYGRQAMEELAVVGGQQIEPTLDDLKNKLAQSRKVIRISDLPAIQKNAREMPDSYPEQPWQRAARLAACVRRTWGLKGKLSNRTFADCLATPEATILEQNPTEKSAISIGAESQTGDIALVIGKYRPDSRRFMLARILGDTLHAMNGDHWFPCTESTTARQKFQRAFAQELLCPYEDLIEWMDTTTPDEELIDAAADHFEVSPLLVDTVLVNHGHRHQSELDAYQSIA